MERREWEPVTRARLIGFAVGFGVFLFFVLRSEPGFVFLLDHANLLFHEAGHPVVGLFSSRLETYGGTIGQLVGAAIMIGIPSSPAGMCCNTTSGLRLPRD
jgi:p-aminobenzoyl-glutamate transporter AbgT